MQHLQNTFLDSFYFIISCISWECNFTATKAVAACISWRFIPPIKCSFIVREVGKIWRCVRVKLCSMIIPLKLSGMYHVHHFAVDRDWRSVCCILTSVRPSIHITLTLSILLFSNDLKTHRSLYIDRERIVC